MEKQFALNLKKHIEVILGEVNSINTLELVLRCLLSAKEKQDKEFDNFRQIYEKIIEQGG